MRCGHSYYCFDRQRCKTTFEFDWDTILRQTDRLRIATNIPIAGRSCLIGSDLQSSQNVQHPVIKVSMDAKALKIPQRQTSLLSLSHNKRLAEGLTAGCTSKSALSFRNSRSAVAGRRKPKLRSLHATTLPTPFDAGSSKKTTNI